MTCSSKNQSSTIQGRSSVPNVHLLDPTAQKIVLLVLANKRAFLGERGPNTWQAQQAVRRRALEVLGTLYTLLGSNCEHVASYVRNGKAASPPLAGAGVVCALGLVVVGSDMTKKAVAVGFPPAIFWQDNQNPKLINI